MRRPQGRQSTAASAASFVESEGSAISTRISGEQRFSRHGSVDAPDNFLEVINELLSQIKTLEMTGFIVKEGCLYAVLKSPSGETRLYDSQASSLDRQRGA